MNVVLTKETSKLVVDITTKAVKPYVPPIARPIIRPLLRIGVSSLNRFGGKHIPDEVDPYINKAVILFNEKQYDQAATAIAIAGDILIDIPNVDDVHERNMFVCFTQGLVNGIKGYIEKKKGA